MSRPVEQALSTIIPRRSGALPPELTELANSLLAQSRNKCSNLKAEEEVARTYACANLACERLKTTLNLPPIEPNPPIPPRAYNKLYAYFDRALTTSTTRKKVVSTSATTTPVKSGPIKSTPTKSTAGAISRPLPQRLTPSKDISFSSFRTPKKGLKFSSSKDKDSRVPAWVMPCIRQLCKDLETPRAAPHVMAGVESILCLPPPPTSTTITDGPILQGKTPALIAAVWFFVVIKMRGKVQQGKETSQRKKLARESLDRARSDPVLLAKVGEDEESWRGWQTVDEKDVNLWRKEIVGKGWREMDWFENVQEGVGVGIGNENSDSEQEIESLDGIETSGEKIHRTGQGKAVLDKYDYLSAAKQNEYQEWKKGLLAKVHGLIEQVVLDEEGDVVMD